MRERHPHGHCAKMTRTNRSLCTEDMHFWHFGWCWAWLKAEGKGPDLLLHRFRMGRECHPNFSDESSSLRTYAEPSCHVLVVEWVFLPIQSVSNTS